MFVSVEGIYRNGQIELKESPLEIQDETLVIVTFMNSGDIDLEKQGIDQNQAAQLQAALATFEDWNEPEMDIYDDYDTAMGSAVYRVIGSLPMADIDVALRHTLNL